MRPTIHSNAARARIELGALLGLVGLLVLAPRAAAAAAPALDAPSPIEATIERMLAGYGDYLAQDLRFDDRNARRFLDGSAVARPQLSAETLGRLADRALETPVAG